MPYLKPPCKPLILIIRTQVIEITTTIISAVLHYYFRDILFASVMYVYMFVIDYVYVFVAMYVIVLVHAKDHDIS